MLKPDIKAKERFLGRVRQALADRGEPIPLPDGHDVARVISSDADPVKVFLERASQAKTQGHRVADENALVSRILDIAREAGARTAIVPDDGLPARSQICAALTAADVQLLDPDDSEAGFTADIGITGAAGGIAETASLRLTSGGGARRLASLAVPVHVGVIRAGEIAHDLLDWATRLPRDMPAAEVLVSAPSKTADIELMLVMGVHGPKQQHMIVLG